jgi:drug/metabolite transporter (DMT)-like permease
MARIYILAIFLGMLSYSMLNIGMGLQKKAAASLPKINNQTLGQNLKNFLTNKTWLLGFFMVQSQWMLLVLALDFAPISMITPLMSIGMIALVVFSYFYLKESISYVEIFGIIAIIIGIIVLGVTNPQEEEVQTLDYVCERMGNADSIIFLTIVFICSVVVVVVSILRKYKNADILFGIAAGITDALGAILLKAYMSGADFRNWVVIKSSIIRWEWWVFFIFMIIFNTVATIYLQVAYQRGKAIIVAPIFAVLAMITPVFSGIIIFDDWLVYLVEGTTWKIILKVVALVIIVAGVVVLSIQSANVQHKKELAKETSKLDEIEESKLEIDPAIAK